MEEERVEEGKVVFVVNGLKRSVFTSLLRKERGPQCELVGRLKLGT